MERGVCHVPPGGYRRETIEDRGLVIGMALPQFPNPQSELFPSSSFPALIHGVVLFVNSQLPHIREMIAEHVRCMEEDPECQGWPFNTEAIDFYPLMDIAAETKTPIYLASGLFWFLLSVKLKLEAEQQEESSKRWFYGAGALAGARSQDDLVCAHVQCRADALNAFEITVCDFFRKQEVVYGEWLRTITGARAAYRCTSVLAERHPTFLATPEIDCGYSTDLILVNELDVRQGLIIQVKSRVDATPDITDLTTPLSRDRLEKFNMSAADVEGIAGNLRKFNRRFGTRYVPYLVLINSRVSADDFEAPLRHLPIPFEQNTRTCA